MSTERFFETRKFRPRLTVEQGAGYWYDVEKTSPKKVLSYGRYKEYHNQTGLRLNRCEIHENRPQMAQCDTVMQNLDKCLKNNMASVEQKKIPADCSSLMESWKNSCGIRR